MFCTNCGATVQENVKFCAHCGEATRSATTAYSAATPVRANQVLIALMLFFAVTGAITEYFASHFIREPSWWPVTSTITGVAIIFWWYYCDSEARSFSRSKWLNIGVVVLGAIAIPYYLVRSREKGQKIKAVFYFVSMAALCFASLLLGGVVGAFVG